MESEPPSGIAVKPTCGAPGVELAVMGVGVGAGGVGVVVAVAERGVGVRVALGRGTLVEV